jgi:hypothetical protein
MDTIMLVAVLCLTNIACFIVGARIGQKAGKDEPIKLPNLNPVIAYREHEAKKEARHRAKEEQRRIDIIMKNIENYDGTSDNQRDVPKGW